MKTVAVLYTCGNCGVLDRNVDVVARRSDESLKHWFEVVMAATLSVDHRRTSPKCPVTMMENVKVPLTPGEQVGGTR